MRVGLLQDFFRGFENMLVKIGMTLLLSLFFDDFGFPCRRAWVIYFILCGITVVFLWFYLGRNKEDKTLFKNALLSAIFLYLCLFGLVNLLNPYKYIPESGTDIQKENMKRCAIMRTNTHESIEHIMLVCKLHDLSEVN